MGDGRRCQPCEERLPRQHEPRDPDTAECDHRPDPPAEARRRLANPGRTPREDQPAGQHLLSIINDILDLSKIEAGKLGLEQTDVDLRAIAANVVSMLQERAQAKGLQLLMDIGPLPDRLQVIRHASASRCSITRATPSFTLQGQIMLRIFAFRSMNGAHLSVSEVTDTGPGIDSETQAHLFSAFEQADNSTTRRHRGMGLGWRSPAAWRS